VVPVGSVGVHDDMADVKRQPGGDRWLVKEQEALGLSQGCAIPRACWNTGVVVCDGADYDICNAPELPFPKTHCSEQHWIQYQITPERMFSLPTAFNFQSWAYRDFKGIEDAHFVHLAGMSQTAKDTALATMRALALGASNL